MGEKSAHVWKRDRWWVNDSGRRESNCVLSFVICVARQWCRPSLSIVSCGLQFAWSCCWPMMNRAVRPLLAKSYDVSAPSAHLIEWFKRSNICWPLVGPILATLCVYGGRRRKIVIDGHLSLKWTRSGRLSSVSEPFNLGQAEPTLAACCISLNFWTLCRLVRVLCRNVEMVCGPIISSSTRPFVGRSKRRRKFHTAPLWTIRIWPFSWSGRSSVRPSEPKKN